jgi:hypothetical protein
LCVVVGFTDALFLAMTFLIGPYETVCQTLDQVHQVL